MGVETLKRFKDPAENPTANPPEFDADPTDAGIRPNRRSQPNAHAPTFPPTHLHPPSGVLHKGLKKF
jgi:hypothetical protein